MRKTGVFWRRALFWLALLGFVAWDLAQSDPVNLRLEPPMVAAGSGLEISAGHCAMPR